MMPFCKTERCKKKARTGGLYCSACATQRWKQANPIKYYYLKLKQSAKRRGKVFDIDPADWWEFFRANLDSFAKRGKLSESLTLDRIDSQGPYSIDNLQFLTNSENGFKK